MRFEILGLHPDILRGVTDAGFEHCTPIQEQSLPECLAGKDVIAQSQTGTGKTAVFLLTIFNRLMAAGTATEPGKPRALVMVPTRELAVQIIQDCEKLSRHTSFRSVAVYGGVEYGKQTGALKEGVDLIAATPGRLIDLYKSKDLSLDAIEIFVIDEADRMFDMGFAPDIMYIASRLSKSAPRQTMLFSATIDSNVRRLASKYMLPDPVMVEIEPEQVTVSLIDQKVFYVSNEEKLPVMLALLRRPGVVRVIIFTNMKSTAERLGADLTANSIAAEVLTGDVTQARRQKIIDGIKSGKINVLVATDVAARGLHIEGVSHVVNFDLPDDAANYVHRIGRTARAGKSGQAYSLVCEDHALNLPEIEKYIEKKLESEWVEEDELVKDFVRGERPRRGRGRERGDRGDRGQRKPDSRQGRAGGGPSRGPRRRPEKKAAPQQESAKQQQERPEKPAGEQERPERPSPRQERQEKSARGQEARHVRSHDGLEKPVKPQGSRPSEGAGAGAGAGASAGAGAGTGAGTGAGPRRRRRPRKRGPGSRQGKPEAPATAQGQAEGAPRQDRKPAPRPRHERAQAPAKPVERAEPTKAAAEPGEQKSQGEKKGLLKRFLRFLKKS